MSASYAALFKKKRMKKKDITRDHFKDVPHENMQWIQHQYFVNVFIHYILLHINDTHCEILRTVQYSEILKLALPVKINHLA